MHAYFLEVFLIFELYWNVYSNLLEAVKALVKADKNIQNVELGTMKVPKCTVIKNVLIRKSICDLFSLFLSLFHSCMLQLSTMVGCRSPTGKPVVGATTALVNIISQKLKC